MDNSDAIAAFDGRTISYTYDNGWSFTNAFDGRLRLSSVPRGDLREQVDIARISDNIYFISWIDDEMGLIAQVIDEDAGRVLAAIPTANGSATEILHGTMSDA